MTGLLLCASTGVDVTLISAPMKRASPRFRAR